MGNFTSIATTPRLVMCNIVHSGKRDIVWNEVCMVWLHGAPSRPRHNFTVQIFTNIITDTESFSNSNDSIDFAYKD